MKHRHAHRDDSGCTDLTLQPSIQAYLDDGTTPSIDGFVRDGKWVPA